MCYLLLVLLIANRKGIRKMTAKEFLNQAYCLNKLIQSHQRELSELEEMGAVISSSNFSGMPSGSRNTEAPFVRQVEKLKLSTIKMMQSKKKLKT